MSLCKYLSGENVAPRTAEQAKGLVGKRVEYLQERDIDKSGRGYFFPQTGVVVATLGKNIAIDDPANFCVHTSSLVEMRVLQE